MEVVVNNAMANAWKSRAYGSSGHMYVYLIKCRVNGKTYIGTTENIKGRLRHHSYELRSGSHANRAMQADFDKYGEGNFEAIIVETLVDSRPLALAMEKNWIRKTKSYLPEYGYNNCPVSKILRGEDPTPWKHRAVAI